MRDTQELILENERLNSEINRLKKAIKKEKYGLVWMEVPEAFEEDSENKLPILSEIPELEIKNDDGKPTHILIEGDNYHALTCLNYTHRGEIDAIVIDPPYNTGSDGFRYKDKRLQEKFPDGTEVPVDHPFRHSYWLSFMRKRLELARDLLKDTGVIFISIDDNELANLRILANDIFDEKNDLGITVRVSNSAKNNSNKISVTHDYCLVYAKNKSLLTNKWSVPKNNYKEFEKRAKRLNKEGLTHKEIERELKELVKYPRFYDFDHYFYCDDEGVYRADNPGGVKSGNFDTDIMHPVTKKPCKKPSGGWRYSEATIREMEKNGLWHFGEDENVIPAPKRYLKDYLYQKPTGIHFFDSQTDSKRLKAMGIDFAFPKPVEYIKHLIKMSSSKNAIILDFFAGSGTTAEAVMNLNDEENASRQFILVTNNENDICTEVCYPRIKNVMMGWQQKNSKGPESPLGNSLKYYRTNFVGKNNILNATDEDKIDLAHQAGELLAIAENTLNLVLKNEFYQLFEGASLKTAIYFREELTQFDDFMDLVQSLDGKVVVYIFSWGHEVFIDDFSDMENVSLKPIPQPILGIFKEIYNLGGNK